MIRQEEIKALKEILSENKDSEINIARSFLEDIVDYFERHVGEKPKSSDRIPIYIEATKQKTTARLKLEGISFTEMFVAVLYDISEQIKPFPMFSKVKMCGKGLEFYLGGNGNLIQKDCKPYDFWFGE